MNSLIQVTLSLLHRAVHHDAFTGAHVDSVYMSRGAKSLMTMWTPMGDIPAEMGVLAVCEGSHNNAGYVPRI